LGAAKFMHTVIASECTGCELCIAPCPVDCIIMKPASIFTDKPSTLKLVQAQLAKRRYDARCLRKENESAEKAERARKQKEALVKMKSANTQQQ